MSKLKSNKNEHKSKIKREKNHPQQSNNILKIYSCLFKEMITSLKPSLASEQNTAQWLAARLFRRPGLPLSIATVVARGARRALVFSAVCKNCDKLHGKSHRRQAKSAVVVFLRVGRKDLYYVQLNQDNLKSRLRQLQVSQRYHRFAACAMAQSDLGTGTMKTDASDAEGPLIP